MIFDTHTHYDDKRFDADRNELLSERLKQAGIDRVMNVASDLSSIQEVNELSKAHKGVYGALGLHPSEIADLTDEVISRIRKLTEENPKIRAVGETGLDYHYGDEDVNEQKRGFIRQIDLAKKLHLPIIVHSRDAARDTLDIIKSRYTGSEKDINGVIHCFSYSAEEARKYTDLGFVIGIGGVVTFKNARKAKETVKEIPLEKLVLETDCPYLAPEPFRGQRNTSLYLSYVIKAIADIKEVTEETVERITYDTAVRLYRIA